mmetsp:Transcript_882/g.1076  ORF Transcript_882/g.1076 Transcript_882/m.1076 type:complete len:209 (-) Transcript_882:1961-2587(-)
MCLAEYATTYPEIFKGKRVLELGSGIGLTGLMIASNSHCEPESIVMTDYEKVVLDNLRHNVHINEKEKNIPAGIVSVRKLDWTEGFKDDQKFDIILAADCVYDPDYIPDLVQLVQKYLCSNPGAVAMFASTKRNASTFSLFKQKLAEAKVKWTDESKNNPPIDGLFTQCCSVMFTRFPNRDDIALHLASLQNITHASLRVQQLQTHQQ